MELVHLIPAEDIRIGEHSLRKACLEKHCRIISSPPVWFVHNYHNILMSPFSDVEARQLI